MLTYSYFQYTWFYFPPTQTFVRVRLSYELIHQVSRVIFSTKAVIYVCGTGMKAQISITFPFTFFQCYVKHREMPKLFSPYSNQFFFSPSLRQRCITQTCLFKSGIRSPKCNRGYYTVDRRKNGKLTG